MIASYFPSLTCLSAGGNQLNSLDQHCLPTSVAEIRLERNQFKSFEDILPLFSLKSLRKLALKKNSVSDIFTTPQTFVSIEDIELSHNEIISWETIDQLGRTFPAMTTLRVSQNPLYHGVTEDVDFLETLARLANLTTLNYSQVSTTSIIILQSKLTPCSRSLQKNAKVPRHSTFRRLAANLPQYPWRRRQL